METQEWAIDVYVRSGHLGALSQVDCHLGLPWLGVGGHLWEPRDKWAELVP